MARNSALTQLLRADLAARLRHQLADLLHAKGPDAPTLCAGWRTKDLAVHLVVRESRPDAALGMFIKPLQKHLQKVTAAYAQRPYAELIEKFRRGPGKFSPLRAFDALINLSENFVHLEDVRRADSDTVAKLPLSLADEQLLWSLISSRAAMFFKHLDTHLLLQWSEQQKIVHAKTGGAVQTITVTGDVQDMLLWLFGRKCAAARLQVSDPVGFAAIKLRKI